MLKKLIFITLFVPQLALAGFSLNPSYGAFKSDSDNSAAQLEFRLGYTFDFGLFVGGFYTLGSEKFLEDASEYYIGPMIGYEYKGIYGLLGYILAGEQDLKSGGIKYTSATGIQATLGYRMLVAEDVYLGPELTLRDVSFDSEEIQGIGSPVTRDESVIIPSVAVLFNF